MTEQTSTMPGTDAAAIVENFLQALARQDFDAFERLVAEDILYQNVGLPSVRGRAKLVELMRSTAGRVGFEVRFHRNVADGGSVLNERTDALTVGPLRIQFWVCGVFDVRDGRVTLWRDYFDVFNVLGATLRGVLGVAIPALRPALRD